MVITAPHPILSEKAKAVLKACLPAGKAGKSILDIIAKMKDVLLSAHDPIGVGLAAPQIGKSLQIFIAKPTPKSPIFTFINPVIEKSPTSHFPTQASHLSRRTSKLEGCLSLPSIWGEVERAEKIKLSFLDETGKNRTRTFRGLIATIIQHEIDHLHGILFTKRVLEQKGKLYKSRKNKKNEEVFERLQLV